LEQYLVGKMVALMVDWKAGCLGNHLAVQWVVQTADCLAAQTVAQTVVARVVETAAQMVES